MKRAVVILSILGAVLAMVALTLSVASAAPSAPVQQVTFTKETSDSTPQIGDVFAFTLNIANVSTETLELRVVDPNPAPMYLRFLTDTLPGTLIFSPTIQAVIWEGEVGPGSAVGPLIFQVEVTGIHSTAVKSGYVVTNTATMMDIGVPGSLPTQTAERAIRIMPAQSFLPFVAKDK
jgi:hypothetical protein